MTTMLGSSIKEEVEIRKKIEQEILERSGDCLADMFMLQDKYQQILTGKEVPIDNIELFKQQVVQMISELGEVLQEDKRWKNNRNSKYLDKSKKLTELVDVLHVTINLFLFSGFDWHEVYLEFIRKNEENLKKLEESKDDSGS